MLWRLRSQRVIIIIIIITILLKECKSLAFRCDEVYETINREQIAVGLLRVSVA